MKAIIVVALLVAFTGTAFAASELIKGKKIAVAGVGEQVISVFKVVDGETECYITSQGKFGSHAISCVK